MSTSTSASNGLEADVLHLADGATMASWTRRPLRRLLVRLLRCVAC